jgi:hypothetical protein
MTGTLSRGSTISRRSVTGAEVTAGAVARSGIFARPVGEGDIDLHGSIASIGSKIKRVVSGAISSSGALSAFKVRLFLVGTLTYQHLSAGATYLVSIAASISPTGALTRLGKFHRRVLSKRILLEDGLDLLLEGGGLVFMEGQKVLSFAGDVVRVVGLKAFSLAGSIDLAGSLLRWQHIKKAIAGSITPAGTLSRMFRVFRGVAAGLSFNTTAAVKYSAHRVLSAVIITAGTLERTAQVLNRAISGSLSFSGKLRKKMVVSISAALSFGGSIAIQAAFTYYRAVAGALSFAATILPTRSRLKRAVSGAIAPAKTLLWELGSKIYGVLSPAGAVVRKVVFYRSQSGNLDKSGTASNTGIKAYRTVAGVLNFRGLARQVTEFVKKGLSKFGFNFDED